MQSLEHDASRPSDEVSVHTRMGRGDVWLDLWLALLARDVGGSVR